MSSRSKDTGYLADVITYDSSSNVGIGAAADGVNKLYVNGTIRQSVASSILKTDSSGKIVSAVAGTDYQAAGAVTSVTATSPIVSTNGTTPTISIPAATTSVNGYLTSTDWTTFNAKMAAFTASTPLSISGGFLTIQQSSTSLSGYLSSTDWNTFNNKQAALGFTAENVANKSTITTLGVSDTLYPTQNAVKTYVDNAVSVGIVIKQSVRVASTANVTISSAPATIDGVTLVSTNRILLKDQTTTSQNGLYVFNGTGSALTRTTDMDTWSEVPKAGVFVSAGTINASSTWLTNVASTGTIDTTAIVWNQLSAATVYTAGVGLTLTGSQFSVTTAGITNAMLAGSIDLTSKVTGILPVANGGTGVSSITASRALVSDASSNVSVSATTSVELGYVSGVTSAIQTQINGKEPSIAAGTTAQYWRGDKTWQTLPSYSLPTASTTVLGGVKVDGTSITIASGVISSTYSYSLPTASTTVLGGVKVDGTSITIASGVISSTYSYSLPIASTTVLGGFKVGSNLSINATTGVLDATYSYSLPTASSSVLGGVKIGSGVSISSGVISVSTAYLSSNGGTLYGNLTINGSTNTPLSINGTEPYMEIHANGATNVAGIKIFPTTNYDAYIGNYGGAGRLWLVGGNAGIVNIDGTGNVTTSGWFVNNATFRGLQNTATSMYFASKDAGYYDISSTGSAVSSLRLFTGGNQTDIRGYLYADTSNNVGILDATGSWRVRANTSGVTLYGSSGCTADFTATAFYESSDIRFKNVIETNPTFNVLGIDVIKFTRKDNEQIRYGYSAQQVQTIIPDAVVGEDELTVNYSDVHTLKIAALEKEIAELKHSIKLLVR